MKKKIILYNFISSSLFYILILTSKFDFNICICSNGEAFKSGDTCKTDCTAEELIDKSCIPISIKEDDINIIFEKIMSHYRTPSVNTIISNVYIKGEGINYIITTNEIQKTNSDKTFLDLDENIINNKLSSTTDFYIVLIDIINTDYMTSSNGIRIFKLEGGNYLLSNLYKDKKINISIPMEVSNEEKTFYKNVKKEYGYNILDIDDSFYVDKCSKFTTSINTDISLKKRNEIYGNSYSKCSEICTYEKYDENENKIYCNCIYGSTAKKRKEIKSEPINYSVIKCINKLMKDVVKNYLFLVMAFLSLIFLICFIITCIKLSSTISQYVKDFEVSKTNFLNYYKGNNRNEKEKNKEREKSENSETEKISKIKEEDNEDEGEDEEDGEISDENDVGYFNNKANNNKQNNNDFNNQHYNYIMNNPYNAYNPYIQYEQYLMYHHYNMMNYMKNYNNQFIYNNIKNNNNKKNEENEEEEEEKEERDEDEEEEDEGNKREKKKDGNKKENEKGNRIIKGRRFFNGNYLPEFKELDKNAVYTLKIDYIKLKEYAKMMKKQKEEEENKENRSKNERSNSNQKNLKKETNKKSKNKEKETTKRKDRDKENKLKNNKDSKKNNLSKNKKGKKEDIYEEITKNNNIKIFKKKKANKNIDDKDNKVKKIANKQIKDIDKDKMKNKRSKSKNNDNNDKLNLNKKHSTDKNKNNKAKIKMKKSSKTVKLNKSNPPKNSMTSERELISSEILPKNEIKLIPPQNQEVENENNEKNINENEENQDKEEEKNNGEEEEKGETEGEGEENEGEEEESDEEKESNINNKNDDMKEQEQEEKNEEKNNEVENKEEEKEKKSLVLNVNSNGDNSTMSNIINQSKNSKLEKISVRKENSLSTKRENNKDLEIKFGSGEFFRLLKKIPEEKRIEFFRDSEMNHIEYKYASDYDERMFFQIYASILKEQNNIIFPFSLCGNDYNIPILKFSFLIIQLILYLTISTLFFGDDAIDNILEKNNKFDVGYMIKPMIFVFLICLVATIILKFLIKINNNVTDIKYEIQKYEEGLNAIRLKIIFYFVISFLIMIFGFLLVSSFSAIFTNSQIKLIKCAVYPLLAHFILSLIFCFLISSFRTCSLNSEKNKTSCLYNFSRILTYI